MPLEKPAKPMHKCAGCERQIPEDVKFCLYCRNNLRKQGLCEVCGKEPIYHPNSNKCFKCKLAVDEKNNRLALERPDLPSGKFRDKDAQENTYETKHGSGHG